MNQTTRAAMLDATTFLDAALAWARRGIELFPCHTVTGGLCSCGRADCQNAGKHPRTEHGVRDATTDEERIKRWGTMWPDSNVAIATGSGSFVVVDVDPEHGGDESLSDLEREHEPLPETWEAVTGGLGRHICFAPPDGVRISNRTALRPGIDIRGDGGYIIAPPSRHRSGRSYVWEAAHHPDEIPLAQLPAWLVSFVMTGDGEGAERRGGESRDWLKMLQGAPDGKRHTVATEIAGHYLGVGRKPEEIEAMLLGFAAQCTPPHDPDDIRRVVRDLAAKDARKRTSSDMRNNASDSAEGCPYRIDGGRICREKFTREGPVCEPLCNFTARVTEEIVLDDGVETSRAFIITGRLDTGRELQSVRVPASRFASMNWVTDHLGIAAVVRAGQATRDHLREAIQRLSPSVTRRQVFTHTGWRKIDQCWIYLTASGGVGQDGIEVDLGPELSRYRLPMSAEDPRAALRTSLQLLRLAPLTVTAPLWAGVYRAPLAEAYPIDLSLWVEGITGSLKTTLAALFLSHFGEFDRTHLPGAWSSTANQLERRAFTLKDTLFVVDDYAPSTLDARELEAKAARLIRSQGNLAGRGRLRADLSERPAFPPRGLVLSTGEQHPSGQSLLARLLVIELERTGINLAALTDAQRMAERLPHALAGYVSWLSRQMASLPALLSETFVGARAKATADGEHLRVPEALAHLWLGLHCGLVYCEEVGACSAVEAETLRKECWDALLTLGRAQGHLVEEERPSRRFLSVLLTLVTQRKAVLFPKEEGTDWFREETPLIGWYDEEALYLIPEAAFTAVGRFCRDSGEPFSVREARLRADLVRERVSDPDPGRYLTTARVGGRPRKVLKLTRAAVERLLGEEFPTPLPPVTTVTTFGD